MSNDRQVRMKSVLKAAREVWRFLLIKGEIKKWQSYWSPLPQVPFLSNLKYSVTQTNHSSCLASILHSFLSSSVFSFPLSLLLLPIHSYFSFFYSFNKYVLNVYNRLGSLKEAGDRAENKINTVPILNTHILMVVVGRDANRQQVNTGSFRLQCVKNIGWCDRMCL